MSSSVVSVSRGADLVRRDRQTLYNHRKQGKLSFVRRDDDSFGVDTAELQRVYGKLYVTAAEIDDNNSSTAESASYATENRLRHQLELRELELEHAQKNIESLKEQVVKSESTVKMIEHQQHQLTEKSEKSEERWKQALAERKNDIDQARAEAADIRQRERDQANALSAEKARVVELESRGFFARVFNKKIESGGVG